MSLLGLNVHKPDVWEAKEAGRLGYVEVIRPPQEICAEKSACRLSFRFLTKSAFVSSTDLPPSGLHGSRRAITGSGVPMIASMADRPLELVLVRLLRGPQEAVIEPG